MTTKWRIRGPTEQRRERRTDGAQKEKNRHDDGVASLYLELLAQKVLALELGHFGLHLLADFALQLELEELALQQLQHLGQAFLDHVAPKVRAGVLGGGANTQAVHASNAGRLTATSSSSIMSWSSCGPGSLASLNQDTSIIQGSRKEERPKILRKIKNQEKTETNTNN